MPVTCQCDGAVATVVLSNPARMNAMTRGMWRELAEVFAQLSLDADLRVVVVRGQGDHFCAGGDISEYPAFRFERASLRAFHEDEVWGGLSAVLACPVPVLAQIDGNCMGAGVEIASCCDIRIASDRAQFGAPIAKLGFPMAPREAQLVASRVGLGLAAEWLLEAAVLPVGRLHALGFVNAVVAPEDLAEQVNVRALRVAAMSPLAARGNKAMLRALSQPGADVEAWVSQAYDYAADPQHREGIEAFLDKRTPRFSP